MGKPMDETVKVVVRCRPMNHKEIERQCEYVIEMDQSTGTVYLRNPKAGPKEPAKAFNFDAVYDWTSIQKNVYNEIGMPIVESVIEGYNGTIFAYGQTGAGKTHTMDGRYDPPDQRGLIPNAFADIFERIATTEGKQFLVRVSYLEIYNEEVRDLLGKDPTKNLDIKEDVERGIFVKDLTSFVVKSVAEIDSVMAIGKKNRTVGATAMNAESSRSHSIFTITIETSEKGPDGQQHIRAGKLNMVDLAGSERAQKTGAQGDRLKEGCKINLSLSALGNVISALVDGKSQHIPYRDSKLTRLLQDSLGGNTRTVMVAACSPADYNYDETLSTLRYASRAKNIKNKPRINEDPKDALLRDYQEEIARLKAQLAGGAGVAAAPGVEFGVGGAAAAAPASSLSDEMIEELKRQAEEEKARVMADKEKAEEEKQKIGAELEERRLELERERQEREALAAKLKALEEHLVTGQAVAAASGVIMSPGAPGSSSAHAAAQSPQTIIQKETIIQEVEVVVRDPQQEEELRRQQEELRQMALDVEEKKQAELLLRQELAEQEEARLAIEDQYKSMEDEIDVKTKKLKKLWSKYQAAKTEITDLQQEFQQEREDLLETIRDLNRQVKLKTLIIENFVPPEEVEKVEKRAEWDDDSEGWRIAHVEYAGNPRRRLARPEASNGNNARSNRPQSEFARMAISMGDPNPRYRYENVLALSQQDMDMPERVTQDWDGGQRVDARYQDNMRKAASIQDDSASVGIANVYFTYAPGGGAGDDGSSAKAIRPQSGKRPGTATRKKKDESAPSSSSSSSRMTPAPSAAEAFPVSRGLVSQSKRMF